MHNKPVKLSQRSVIQIKSLGLTEDDIMNAADVGQKIHESKNRFRIILCTKKGASSRNLCGAARPPARDNSNETEKTALSIELTIDF